jgi:hypothetical protein
VIRCTVPGLTPNCLAMTRTPGLPGVARASRIRFSSAGAIGGAQGVYPHPCSRSFDHLVGLWTTSRLAGNHPAPVVPHWTPVITGSDQVLDYGLFPEKADFYGRLVMVSGGVCGGVRMNIDDSRLVVRFQRLITEMLVERRLGQRRPELTDELYQTWREVEQRGLKETPEYRDVLLRVDRHAVWLAGLVQLAARPVSSPAERTDTLDLPQQAA